jgi:nitrite reductase/ring-hydroxylating ferredoxin subunit
MDRRRFIQQGCLACGAAALGSALLTSCASAMPVTGTVEGEDLVIPESAFQDKKGGWKLHVVATHAQLKQPIAVFRENDGYRSVLMRCTHKGVELRVAGDRLECPAHGSVFANSGAVLEGPADTSLRVLPTRASEGKVLISLKA